MVISYSKVIFSLFIYIVSKIEVLQNFALMSHPQSINKQTKFTLACNAMHGRGKEVKSMALFYTLPVVDVSSQLLLPTCSYS